MDLAGWLRSLGLPQYEQAFRDNAIDWDLLPHIQHRGLAVRRSSFRLVFILRGLSAEAIQNSLLRFQSLGMSVATERQPASQRGSGSVAEQRSGAQIGERRGFAHIAPLEFERTAGECRRLADVADLDDHMANLTGRALCAEHGIFPSGNRGFLAFRQNIGVPKMND
jgi:hypothetical protein